MKQQTKINKDAKSFQLKTMDWLLIGLIVLNIGLIVAFINVDKVLIFLLDTLGVPEWYIR